MCYRANIYEKKLEADWLYHMFSSNYQLSFEKYSWSDIKSGFITSRQSKSQRKTTRDS